VDERNGLEPPGWLDDAEEARLRSSAAYGQWLMARDSKCTPLKSLQGRIWQQGSLAGNCTAKFFPMCPSHSNDGGGQKKSLAPTRPGASSRSNSCFALRPPGDLTSYISVFFDTRVGARRRGKLQKIAGSLSHAPHQFLFVSDAVKEIEAATSVECRRSFATR